MSTRARLADLFGYRGPGPRELAQQACFRAYEHLRDSEHCASDRRYIRRMWARFCALGLGDPRFVERFPFECRARIWELHAAFVFDRWRWELVPSKRPGAGPDFGLVMRNGSEKRTMWIEATAPAPGTGSNRSGYVDVANGIQTANGAELQRTQSLRILQAIQEKIAQHSRWLAAGLVEPSDGFTIAISGSRWDGADLEDGGGAPPVVARCLYGIGRPTFSVAIDGTGRARPGEWTPGGEIEKQTASGIEPIPGAPFLRGACPQVSAVLFCPNHIKNRPSRAGRDFVLVHNPAATTVFPHGELKRGREFYLRLGERRRG